MGIKSLKKVLQENCVDGITDIQLRSLKKSIIGIDTSIFLYKYKSRNMLEKFIIQISHLLKYDITPVYIFDGKPTEDKSDLMNQRRNKWVKIRKEIDELYKLKENFYVDVDDGCDINGMEYDYAALCKKIAKKEKSVIKIDFAKVEVFKNILTLCDIHWFQSESETDFAMKKYSQKNLIDYAITEDTDFLTHDCKKVLYGYDYTKTYVTLYDQNLILKDLEISMASFIDMCILMGCDYNVDKGAKGIGPKIAYKLIKKHKNIETIIETNKTKKINLSNFEYEIPRKMFSIDVDIKDTKRSDITIKTPSINDLKELLTTEKINKKVINKLVELLDKNKLQKVKPPVNSILKWVRKK